MTEYIRAAGLAGGPGFGSGKNPAHAGVQMFAQYNITGLCAEAIKRFVNFGYN